MEFRHSKILIQKESSKHVITGHYSDTASEKYLGFLRFIVFSTITLFIYPIFAAVFSKRLYHPYVYTREFERKLPISLASEVLSRSNYRIDEDETPEILIMASMKNFIMFTNKNVYYELLANSKILNTKTTSGKIPLSQARDIKLRNHMTSCDVMMGEEVLGTLQDGQSPRINRLLKEVAKDVRETLKDA